MINETEVINAAKEVIDIIVDAIRRAAEAISQLWAKICRYFAPVAKKYLENYFRGCGVSSRCVHLAFHSKKRRIRKKNMRRCFALLAVLT